MAEHKQKPVGDYLREVHRFSDELERLIEASEGEITEEVEAAEAAWMAAESEAIEQLANYVTYCDSVEAAIEAETQRLAEVRQRNDMRRAWCLDRIRPIAERRVADKKRKSFDAGLHVIQLRAGSESVEVDDGLDATSLPAELQRWTDPKPAACRVDKTAAKQALKAGSVIPGLRLVRGESKVVVK